MRGRLALALVGLLVVAGSAAVGSGQDWRPGALASFDEVWQTINDTYPDPTFGGLDWPGVRDELRPRAVAADSPDGVRKVIREMIGRLGQSHFELLSPPAEGRVRGEAMVPVETRVFDGQVVIVRVTSRAAGAAGLAPGQILRAVDGRPAADWFADVPEGDDHRQPFDVLTSVNLALSGPDGSTARVQVTGASGDKTVDVSREREPGTVVRFGNLPPLVVRVEAAERRTPGGHRVGVIGFNIWMPIAGGQIDTAVDRFRDTAGLVLDLRGNLGGLVEMMRGVAGHVIDEEIPLGRMHTRDADLPLKVNPRRATADGRHVTPFAGPFAILVDELTASASECFAGSLQSLGRARVFGRRTMGQALPAATHRLPSGDVLLHVLGDFVTPNGTRLEGRGVIPDVTVPFSIEALRAGRDPVLERALAWIDREASMPRERGRLP